MADSEKTDDRNTKPKGHVLPETAQTQKTDKDDVVVKKRDGSTRTADEDIFLPEKILDSKTLISEDDYCVLKKTNAKEIKSSVISENSIELDKASDSLEPKENISLSIDDIAIPGPSNSLENMSQPNISEQNIEIRSPLKHTEEESTDSALCLACKKKKIFQHIETHGKREKFKCCQCEYFTFGRKKLKLHIFSHDIEVKCDVCKNTFQSLSMLEDHYLTHEIHHKNFCILCEKKINKHIVEGKGRKKFICCNEECRFETGRKKRLMPHLYTHSLFEIFKCKLCGKRCRTKTNLRRHSKKHLKHK